MPGCIDGKLYTPASLLRASRDAFVLTLVAVIFAPGIAPPVESTICPVISPSVWLKAGAVKRILKPIAKVARHMTSPHPHLPLGRFGPRVYQTAHPVSSPGDLRAVGRTDMK